MFLLSAQNNYILLSSYVEGHVKKNPSLNFMSPVGFHALKICMFFWKSYYRAIFKVTLGRKIP